MLRDFVKAVVPRRLRSALREWEARTVDQPGDLGPKLAALMTRDQWSVDVVEWADDTVDIRGWALPADGRVDRRLFLVNGREFESVEYPQARDDIARLFWYLPAAGAAGFGCRTRIAADELFRDGFAEFRFAVRGGGRASEDDCTSYYADPRLDVLPFPDPARRVRVHGSELEGPFRIEGASTFVKLRDALRRTLGRELRDFSRILDWGCGCGRSTRHFARVQGPEIWGVDIDRDNAAWCAAHLPFGRFEAVPLHPPTELDGDAFDLLIGISVFTHLAEAEQFEWLAELQRIARPDAVLLMTVHGDAAVCRSGLSQAHFNLWTRHGFLDAGLNPDLTGAIPDRNYYRNSFQRADYVRERWAPYFEVLDILPGCIGSFQDLVIMRKR